MLHSDDYPDATVSSFKKFKYTEQPKENPKSVKVLTTNREVARRERERARQLEQAKRLKQQEDMKMKIRQEIERKKKEIEELELQRVLAEQQQLRSFELARIKEQEYQEQLLLKQARIRELERNTRERTEMAARRLKVENDLNAAKQKEAMYRRQVAEQAEKIEREKAIRKQQIIDAKKAQEVEEQPLPFDNFNKTLGTKAYIRQHIDYTKTCLHNPIMVKHQIEQQNTAVSAYARAQQVQQEEEETQEERLAREEASREAAVSRGRTALQKLSDQKFRQQMLRENQERKIQHNMEKVEMGKKNQYLGLKPITLYQMQVNKKLRNQQEFEDMFFGGKEWVAEQATPADIANHRQQLENNLNTANSTKFLSRPSKIQKPEPVKYSFDDFNYVESSKGEEDRESYADSLEDAKQTPLKTVKQYAGTQGQSQIDKPMIKPRGEPKDQGEGPSLGNSDFQLTKITENKHNSLRQSAENTSTNNKNSNNISDQAVSYKQERQRMLEFIKQNEQFIKQKTQNKNQRRVVYKDDEAVLDRYNPSADKGAPKGLSNICENRDQHNDDLDYSADSIQD